MPGFTHEIILALFRNRPELAPDLVREALHVPMPKYTAVQVVESALADLHPVEYRADLVVLLRDETPVMGIVVEVQLKKDRDKWFSWPAYAALLRSRERCPVCVLVFAADEAVAEWARQPIHLGGGNRYIPWVISPRGVPMITDERQAQADPELAVLSAMSHANGPDRNAAVQIALAAQFAAVGLDVDRSKMYFDLICNSLPETIRQALFDMNPVHYQYQSEFAKRYVAQGKVEGEAQGRADLLVKLLSLKFGPLNDEVHARVRNASIAELDRAAERLLTARSLAEVWQ
jgi:hypothetical protein